MHKHLLLLTLLLTLGAAAGWSQKPPAPKPNDPTLNNPDSAYDEELDREFNPSCIVRDIVTGKKYTFQVENQLMILESRGRGIDTFVTGSIDHYPPDFNSFYKTFVVYRAVSRGNPTSGNTYVFCVVNGHIHLSAIFTSFSGFGAVYEAKAVIRKLATASDTSYQLRITEHVEPGGAFRKPLRPYTRTYHLLFDPMLRIFIQDSISLDRIPTEASEEVWQDSTWVEKMIKHIEITGKYPAIILRESTTFYDGCWRWVSCDEDEHYLRHPSRKGHTVSDCE